MFIRVHPWLSVRCLLGLAGGLALAGCATSTVEEDRAQLLEKVTAVQMAMVRSMGVELGSAGTGGGSPTGTVIDRWPEIRERYYTDPRDLLVDVNRMVADADRLRASLDARAVALSGEDAIRWREANEQLRQARARLDAQLSQYETAPLDRREEFKREIEAAWRQTQQRLDALRANTP